MRLIFSTTDEPAARVRYTTPGDPICPLDTPNDDYALPAWMAAYFRCSIETEYPVFALDDPAVLAPPTHDELRLGADWLTSGAQARELARLGLPAARSWRMAHYLLDAHGDGQPVPKRARVRRVS